MSPRVRLSAAVLAVLAILIHPALAAASPAAPAAPAPTDTATFELTGALAQPATLTVYDLHRFPAERERVRFESGEGTQRHTFTGALLLDVLNAAQPRFDPNGHNDKLGFAVTVTAIDGYQATVSWAEFDPDYGDDTVLLAYEQDGKPLERPRLVVPGDEHGGRYVSDIDTVELTDLGHTLTPDTSRQG